LTWPVALTTVQHYRADCDVCLCVCVCLILLVVQYVR